MIEEYGEIHYGQRRNTWVQVSGTDVWVMLCDGGVIRWMRTDGTPSPRLPSVEIVERCCDPVSCGVHMGDPKRLKAREEAWDEERRGWSNL
jgi:hypothetical protein